LELRQACALTARLADRKQAVLKDVKGAAAAQAGACAAAVEALVCAEQSYQDGRSSERVAALLARAFPAEGEIGPAYGLRSQLALDRGRLARAMADAERAVALSPGEWRGYYVRGRVRLERGQEGALTDLARAAELTGRRDALALHWLAAALAQQGRAAEALAAQREAVGLRPHDPELLEQLRLLEAPAARGAGNGRGE
jgi:tetratricopeptide (TPR) repeat protein